MAPKKGGSAKSPKVSGGAAGGMDKPIPTAPKAMRNTTAPGSSNNKKVGKNAPITAAPTTTDPAAGTAAPPQKTLRELIGGPSWTGKLPMTLLHEHCVRLGWDPAPTYRSYRHGSSLTDTEPRYLANVTLYNRHPKTNEKETISFTPPAEFTLKSGETRRAAQGTAGEAKHIAATYALHRVSSMKNIQVMLPQSHQSWWRVFEEVRKADVKAGRTWMYEADPWVPEREKRARIEKAREEGRVKEAAAAAAQAAAADATGGMGQGRSIGHGEKSKKSWTEDKRLLMKGWNNVPVAEMAKDVRKRVEELVRKYHVWNPSGIHMSDSAKQRVVKDITCLGFRKSHVEEACEWTKDKEECLGEFLCWVPELARTMWVNEAVKLRFDKF